MLATTGGSAESWSGVGSCPVHFDRIEQFTTKETLSMSTKDKINTIKNRFLINSLQTQQCCISHFLTFYFVANIEAHSQPKVLKRVQNPPSLL